MKSQKGFTLVELVITLSVLVVAPCVIGGIGYVAYHFLSKVW